MKENIEQVLSRTDAYNHWKKIGIKDHHGIAIPLFSLYGEKSAGIGEYLDLLPLIAWCKDVGLDTIQLLPLNDIGLGSSPYNAISAFALSPLYLSLHELPGIEKIDNHHEKLKKISYWNKTSRVKYHIVRELKFAILRSYYEAMFPTISHSEDYLQFIQNNTWLKPYAVFRTIKELQFWKEWERWSEELKKPTSFLLHQIYARHKIDCEFLIFLQFLCYEQMIKVKKYAEKKDVMIKGDISILVSRDSADVWMHPEIFQLKYAAGAPPDVYAKKGQYWGFPLYNWDILEENGYEWWKERLRVASQFFHLYRIDHVVGFYKMWSIPLGSQALEGHYSPEKEKDQQELGEKLMKMMLSSTMMLPIGEDLGLVPQWIKTSLHQLGICTTKMMRWERHWESDLGFINPMEYSPISMTTVSTHDSDDVTAWWRHSPKEAKLFAEAKGWPYQPFLSTTHLKEILRESHHSNSLFHINLLTEYLSLFPDLKSYNTRINVPGKISDHNWTFRLPVPIETLVKHQELKDLFKEILSSN